MPERREYPERPIIGVGGVVISDGRVLLARRGGLPLQGQWSTRGGDGNRGASANSDRGLRKDRSRLVGKAAIPLRRSGLFVRGGSRHRAGGKRCHRSVLGCSRRAREIRAYGNRRTRDPEGV